MGLRACRSDCCAVARIQGIFAREERRAPSNRIDVIHNWADETALATKQGSVPVGFPRPDRFRILFAGNMGKAQALDAVLEAAGLLQSRGSSVTFVLMGGGVDVSRLKEIASFKGKLAECVIFFPPVPMNEVGSILRAADALLVHLRKDALFEITIPSKTQAYMAVGRPILLAVKGDAADLVLQSGGGVVAESENAEALARAAEGLAALAPEQLRIMGQRAEHYYQEHLALAVGVAKFGEIFKNRN